MCIYIYIYTYTHIYIYIYIIQEAEAWIKVKWQKQNKTLKLDEITEISTGFCWIHSTAKEIDPFSVPKTGRTFFSQGWKMISLRKKCDFQYDFQYISNIFLRLEMPSQNQASDFWRKFAPWVRDYVQGWSWWSDLPGCSVTKIGKFLGFSWRIVGFCWDFENHSFLNIVQ